MCQGFDIFFFFREELHRANFIRINRNYKGSEITNQRTNKKQKQNKKKQKQKRNTQGTSNYKEKP